MLPGMMAPGNPSFRAYSSSVKRPLCMRATYKAHHIRRGRANIELGYLIANVNIFEIFDCVARLVSFHSVPANEALTHDCHFFTALIGQLTLPHNEDHATTPP